MTRKETKPRACDFWQECGCTHSPILPTVLGAGIFVCLFETHFSLLITLNLLLI